MHIKRKKIDWKNHENKIQFKLLKLPNYGSIISLSLSLSLSLQSFGVLLYSNWNQWFFLESIR